jgi:DNA-binding beta-propeller fold protein YncE
VASEYFTKNWNSRLGGEQTFASFVRAICSCPWVQDITAYQPNRRELAGCTRAPSSRRPSGQLAAAVASALLAAALSLGPASAESRTNHFAPQRLAELHVPGSPLASFDISVVDGDIYALADRSNHGVDLFNAEDDSFLGRAGGFAGSPATGGFAGAGPNGLVAVGPRQIWAGDGDSTVKIIDTGSQKVIETIRTGGSHRVDELAYDPQDHLVVTANNADEPPFLTFIATTTGDHKLTGRLVLPQASDGLEQPVWDPASDLVYVSVPELNGRAAQGGVAVIDPRTRELLRIIPVTKCIPAGLAIGPNQQLLVACSDDAVAAGFPAKSMILDLPSGKIVRIFHQIGGSDEVWFDKAQGEYYLAAVANPGGPVLGVINARTDRWVANLPTGPHAHSVAAYGATGQVFVPITPTKSDAQCVSGCIAVFGPRH